MNNDPAMVLQETRRKVAESEQKLKLVEDLNLCKVDDWNKKALLISILDPETKKYIAVYHEVDFTHTELKIKLLKCCNDMHVPLGEDPMMLGRVRRNHRAQTGTKNSGATGTWQ